MDKYEYKGKPLDSPIAVELIIEIFQGQQHIQRKIIRETIERIHIEREGLPPPKDEWNITEALDALKRLQLADNSVRGQWNIVSIDEMVARFEHLRTKFRNG